MQFTSLLDVSTMFCSMLLGGVTDYQETQGSCVTARPDRSNSCPTLCLAHSGKTMLDIRYMTWEGCVDRTIVFHTCLSLHYTCIAFLSFEFVNNEME